MVHTELDLRERRAIEDMLNANVPMNKIAAEVFESKPMEIQNRLE